VVLVVLISILDYLTGEEAIFYLLPIAMLAWFGGRGYGVAFALLGTLAWLTADLATARSDRLVLVRYWNVAVRLGYFVIVSLALSRLRIAFERERAFARLDPTTGIANGRAFVERVLAATMRDTGRRPSVDKLRRG
jgi:hypothetical protein